MTHAKSMISSRFLNLHCVSLTLPVTLCMICREHLSLSHWFAPDPVDGFDSLSLEAVIVFSRACLLWVHWVSFIGTWYTVSILPYPVLSLWKSSSHKILDLMCAQIFPRNCEAMVGFGSDEILICDSCSVPSLCTLLYFVHSVNLWFYGFLVCLWSVV